jgi:hypothetical protein
MGVAELALGIQYEDPNKSDEILVKMYHTFCPKI